LRKKAVTFRRNHHISPPASSREARSRPTATMSFTIKATYGNQTKVILFETPAIPPHAIINAKVSFSLVKTGGEARHFTDVG
jgi:predicted membrane-bound dolichyl-phosphate-mannose-protein mannosyltransferase